MLKRFLPHSIASARALRPVPLPLLLSSLLVWCATAQAASFTVTTLSDSGPGSLRESITRANLKPDPDTIRFASKVRGILLLTSALPELSSNITILGPGQGHLNVQRNSKNPFRIFFVTPKGSASINDLTLSKGSAVVVRGKDGSNQSRGVGGGINNEGVLQLNRCTLTHNLASEGGGGLYNGGPQMSLHNCLITANSCLISDKSGYIDGGGGLLNEGTNVLITNSTFSGNLVDKLPSAGASDNSGGGAIASSTGMVRVLRSTFSGNVAKSSAGAGKGGNGGALCGTGEYGGSFDVAESAIINNTAVYGGAASSGQYGGGLSLRNCTVSGNKATRAIGALSGDGYGGMKLENCTVFNNVAPRVAGISTSQNATINNSIIAGNLLPSRAPGIDVSIWEIADLKKADGASPLSGGGNLIGLGDAKSLAFFHAEGDRRNVSPSGLKLGPLALNGGSTPTHALLSGSPAIGKGIYNTPLRTDQRGELRPYSGIDSGAFQISKAKHVAPR